jgi:hypothetical protein
VVRQTLGPTWDLHLVDVNIALGDLVDLVGSEARPSATDARSIDAPSNVWD